MNHKQLYQDTFDSFKMSEEALRKVKDMSENNKKNCRKTGFRAAAAVVAVVFAFAIGNAAVYAATGSAPVTKVADKVIERVSVYINDKKADDAAVDTYMDKEGNTHMEMTVDPDTHVSGEFNSEALEDENISIIEDIKSRDGRSRVVITLISGALKQKGDRVLLVIGDNLKTIDITEDFSDGSAKGKVKIKGKSYKYSVSGTVKDPDIDIARE